MSNFKIFLLSVYSKIMTAWPCRRVLVRQPLKKTAHHLVHFKAFLFQSVCRVWKKSNLSLSHNPWHIHQLINMPYVGRQYWPLPNSQNKERVREREETETEWEREIETDKERDRERERERERRTDRHRQTRRGSCREEGEIYEVNGEWCVCVCDRERERREIERERERERESLCVLWVYSCLERERERERERESLCVLWVYERERERESLCVLWVYSCLN